MNGWAIGIMAAAFLILFVAGLGAGDDKAKKD